MLSNMGKLLFHQPLTRLINPTIRNIATNTRFWIRPLSQRLLLTTIPIYFYTSHTTNIKC